MGQEDRYRSVRRRLLAFAFADEFVPLYAFYALLFRDNGLSPGQISVALVVWSVAGLLLEVPSGGLADRVSRRRLLAVATVLKTLGWALWLLSPSFASVVVGFALWGASTAAASGTAEALIYDELDRLGRADRYAPLMARLTQASNVAIALSSLTAAPLVALVGISGVGWVSVAVGLAAAALVLRLPEAPPVEDADGDGFGAWWATLRDGVARARRTPVLARLVVLGAVAEGLGFVDEYLPLAARERGAENAVVPLITVLAWVGFVAGAEVAARRPHLSSRAVAWLSVVGVGGLLAAVGTSAPWSLALIGLLYASLQTTSVLADARLQEHTTSATRATVTSVRGFLSEVTALVGFAAIGGVTALGGLTAGLSVLVLPAVAVVVLVARWLPPPRAAEGAAAPVVVASSGQGSDRRR